MEKIILSVEIHNNREFVVWRTEDDTAIATLCNTTKGGYLVNTIRVAAKDMKSMKVIYTFSDISRAICDVEKHIEEEFGKCVFLLPKAEDKSFYFANGVKGCCFDSFNNLLDSGEYEKVASMDVKRLPHTDEQYDTDFDSDGLDLVRSL